jgi:predicted Abi (CAAX) family protease
VTSAPPPPASNDNRGRTGPIADTIASLKRLPDLRAAIEGLILFLMVLVACAFAASNGVLDLKPLKQDQLAVTWLSAFLVPTLSEELIFRGWVKRGARLAAVASLLAYILWHPLQTLIGLPFGRPEFLDPAFLSLVACLGLACTLSRIRSGSIWPAVIIHWGIVVLWISLYGG